jgi:MFS family permease
VTWAALSAARLRRQDRPNRWRGWAVAASVYFFAVLHRTSLGVAGVQAEHRFHVGPGALSVFVFLQLGVYAAMQVPTGLLVDRFGPRRLLVVASLVMGAAQLVFASVPSYPAALAARAVLGCGDALTFISVLRFTATHFSARRYPLLITLTSALGTLGNVVATLPLAALLRHIGWQSTFASAAVLSFVAAAAVLCFVPGSAASPQAEPVEWRQTFSRNLRGVVSLPATRMGFWVHFSSMCTATAFGVLWGGVYLQKAAGFSGVGAGAVLMACVIGAAVASPLLGNAIGKHPATRVPISLVISAVTLAGWIVSITALGDGPPKTYVVGLFLVMFLGGPASMSAFAIARDYNQPGTLGSASGVVNVGGFVATIVIALGMGIALDAQGGTSAHTLRFAVLVALAVQGFGVWRVVVWYLRVRAAALAAQERGESPPVAARRHRWDLAAVPALDEGAAAVVEDELDDSPSRGGRS